MTQKPDTTRWVVAFIVAVVSDVVSYFISFTFFPQIGVDAATAFVIWSVLGWRRVWLVALFAESIPGVSMFPTWTLVVLALKGRGMIGKKNRPMPPGTPVEPEEPKQLP
ncbi:MAG TPA: hypothetical protein VFH88_03090 [Candidatus Krumholzibacteria bacterium]|nr:hypothetical protein [Candidatus Krumholzibacteria bacterium]